MYLGLMRVDAASGRDWTRGSVVSCRHYFLDFKGAELGRGETFFTVQIINIHSKVSLVQLQH